MACRLCKQILLLIVDNDMCIRFRGPWGLCRSILRTEGVKGFFCGLTSTIAREMPGYACFFGGYEGARSLFTPPGTSKDDIGILLIILYLRYPAL